ncbi:hypothetical protein CEXT_469261 [Caerostris extrusa]|uniref:Uncharacterized protein n=1 Tax=Caerostris extrusa TaxID=172846 RepID=A0AAV4NGM1_CAEEX|nr:hypothetical protein CEXT_469261 [Caerostris extrusa]
MALHKRHPFLPPQSKWVENDFVKLPTAASVPLMHENLFVSSACSFLPPYFSASEIYGDKSHAPHPPWTGVWGATFVQEGSAEDLERGIDSFNDAAIGDICGPVCVCVCDCFCLSWINSWKSLIFCLVCFRFCPKVTSVKKQKRFDEKVNVFG